MNIGDVYGNLKVVYIKGSVVECKCVNCRTTNKSEVVSMMYRKSKLLDGTATCRMCELKGEAVVKESNKLLTLWRDAILNEMKWSSGRTSELLNKEYPLAITDKSTLISLPRMENSPDVDSIVGDYIFKGVLSRTTGLSKAGYLKYDRHNVNVMVKCNHCGIFRLISVAKINSPNKCKCPICYESRQLRKSDLQDKSTNKKARVAEKSSKKMLPHTRNWVQFMKDGSALDRNVKDLEALNPNFVCVDATKDGGITYTVVCKKCGSDIKVGRKNHRIEKCYFCEKRSENEFGRLYQDHIGLVRNGLVVIGQYNDELKCNVECIYCKRQHIIPLYDFLEGRYYCDCPGLNKQFSDCYCSNEECGALLPDITAVSFFKSKDALLCPSCRANAYNAYASNSALVDYSTTMRRKISLAEKAFSDTSARKVRLNFSNEELIVESKPLYKGNTTNIGYYRCMCKKHSKMLLLSDDEVKTYGSDGVGHYACFDIRHRAIPYLNVDNLKL